MKSIAHYHAAVLDARALFRFATLPGAHREFAFYLPRAESDDAGSAGNAGNAGNADKAAGDAEPRLRRYNSYASADALRADLQRNEVVRIELGACFSVPPIQIKFLGLDAYAVARELVFDIDIDAYDVEHVVDAAHRLPPLKRRCCRGAQVCARCWPLLACAAECIDVVLRAHLGLAHVLYVFSGRRGVHVWVCDSAAALLGERARRIVPATFGALARALGAGTERARASATAPELEPYVGVIAVMRRHAAIYAERQGGGTPVDALTMLPRLDAAVTTQIAHLLRAPLVAHHKNGGIALPLPLADIVALDPARGVTVDALLGGDARAAELYERARAHFASFVDAAEARARQP